MHGAAFRVLCIGRKPRAEKNRVDTVSEALGCDNRS